MRNLYLLAPLLALAAPAAAGPYVEGGLGLANVKSNDIDETIDFTASQSPASPSAGAAADVFVDDVFGTRNKTGTEGSIAGGYDFGWLRLEGELTHKRSRFSGFSGDDDTAAFLAQVNGGLNRPSAAPDPGAPGLPALGVADFQRDGRVKASAAMANALLDLTLGRRLTLFLGAGGGRSWVSGLGDKDSATAFQLMTGARTPVGDRLELGLKLRYFNSGVVTLVADPRSFAGNADAVSVGGTVVNRLTSASVTPTFEGEFRTRSATVTLGYRF
jgi:opacity protein-like surface antigen